MTEKEKFKKIKENYLDFLKQFLKFENKKDLYLLAEDNSYNINSLFFKLFGVTSKIYKVNHNLSDDELLLLKKYKDNMSKIISKLRIDIYNDWIKSDNKEYIYKSACGFDRKLKCYKRDFNFTINSINEPLTDDELIYLQKFFNETYEVSDFDLKTINTFSLTIALTNLLNN